MRRNIFIALLMVIVSAQGGVIFSLKRQVKALTKISQDAQQIARESQDIANQAFKERDFAVKHLTK